MAFHLVFVAARVGIGLWLLARVAGLPRTGASPDRSACAVVIPARDEVEQLPGCLAAVLGQLRPGDELVVVDDHSGDGTADRARSLGATVRAAPPLPHGWTGKCLACWTGAGATAAPVVVFLDADTVLAPGTLDALVAEVERTGALVSVQPYHRVPTAVEKLSALFNVVALMASDAFTGFGGRREPSVAFGPVLALPRAGYEAVGGHASVAGEVVEDVALARRWRTAGRPLVAHAGGHDATFRMYPGGWSSLVEGWSKNLAAGAGAVRTSTALLVALWVSLPLEATVELGRAAVGRSPFGAPAALGLAAVVAVQLWWALRRVGSFGPLTALLFPLPTVVFLGVFARSALRLLTRSPVRWKGRSVPNGRRTPKPGGRSASV